jgi:1-acyl-sn-glycerol-3-phosphate acyltransferase
MAGLKETLRRLKQQRIVVVFPEGTRTPDGEVQDFKPGFIALARRGGVPLLPAAIDGAAQSWPRKAKAPRPGKIVVVFGEPLSLEKMEKLSDDDLLAEVQRRVEELHRQARCQRRSATTNEGHG